MAQSAEETRNRRAGTLSGGEQQMLALARALRFNPKVLLLDEPSSGLAPLVVDKVMETLADAAKRGISVVLVEQQAQAALDLADEVLLLSSGRVSFYEKRDQLRPEDLERVYLGATTAAVASAE